MNEGSQIQVPCRRLFDLVDIRKFELLGAITKEPNGGW
jgi:hypothetical protein